MLPFFFCLCVLLGVSSTDVFSSSRDVSDFSGVFDEGIYDVTPIPTGRMLGSGEPEIIIDPVEILKERKRAQLAMKYVSVLETLVSSYRSALMAPDSAKVGEGFMEGVRSTINDLRRGPITGVLSAVYNIFDGFESLLTRKPKDDRYMSKRLVDFKKIDNPQIEFEITKIKAEIAHKLRALDFEPALSSEIKYVTIKPQIFPDLYPQIERSLILLREVEDIYLEIEKRFIESALALPIESLQIISIPSRNQDIRGLVAAVRREFSTFSPAVIRELEDVVIEIATNSITPGEYDGALRSIRYFWGKPGGGKTTAVEKIVRILGLPYSKVTISSSDDLSKARLEGIDRFSAVKESRGMGWFVSPLLSVEGIDRVVIGRTFKNSILLIDDVDLEISADEVLSILKLYLDPLTKCFFSPYFGCNIDISQMNIFITSNQRIPLEEKYKALRSRVKEVEFDVMPMNETSLILRQYAERERLKYGLTMTEEELTEVIREALGGFAEEERDLRKVRRAIGEKMLDRVPRV